MFHVGDEVYSKRFGVGCVTDVDDNNLYIYPIHVQWKNRSKRSLFTQEGRYNISFNDPDVDICFLKAGQFKVGDHVISKYFGEGVVDHITDPEIDKYPVQVYWIGAVPRSFNSCEYYTPKGEFNTLYPQPEFDIIKKNEDDEEVGKISAGRDHNSAKNSDENYEKMMGLDDKIFHNLIHDLMKKNDEGTVERMEDALDKKVEDAINPSHYKVEGLPDAIDIINHLMHREQYEGFLWGNILKYAYRYGRKGDKAETAGKIEWYAKQLKDLAEEVNRK